MCSPSINSALLRGLPQSEHSCFPAVLQLFCLWLLFCLFGNCGVIFIGFISTEEQQQSCAVCVSDVVVCFSLSVFTCDSDPNTEDSAIASDYLSLTRLSPLPQSSRLACDSSVSSGDAEQLRSLCSRDPLYELSEQEKDFLWRHR